MTMTHLRLVEIGQTAVQQPRRNSRGWTAYYGSRRSALGFVSLQFARRRQGYARRATR